MASDDQSGARPAGPVVLRIKLRYDDIETMVQRFAPNVGKSGLFLPTKSIQPIGTEVKFELRIASDTPVLVGLGRVKHTRPPDPAAPKAAFGMAIELMRVSREGRELILRMLERRRAMGLPEVAIPLPEDVDAAKRSDDTQPRTDASGVVRDYMPKLASAPIAESVLGSRAPASGPIAVAKSPAPSPEPAAEPKRESQPDLKSEAAPESKRESAPELKSEPAPEPKSEPAPEPKSEPAPESTSERAPTKAERAPEPKRQPYVASSEPAPEPRPEPVGKAQTKIAALPPETAKSKRPRVSDLMAKVAEQRAAGGAAATPMPPELDENIDVARVIARARALAGSDLDSELAALREVQAAPLEISIEAASAELARQLGGKPITKRERSAKWVPPPAVEVRAERTRVEPAPAESVSPAAEPVSPAVETPAPAAETPAPAAEAPAPTVETPEPAAATPAPAAASSDEHGHARDAAAATDDASSDEHARPSESAQQARERRRNRTFSRKRQSSRSQEMLVPPEPESSPEVELAAPVPAKRADDIPTATGDALGADQDDPAAEFAHDVKTRVPTGDDYADVMSPLRASFSNIDEEALRTEPAVRPSSNLMIDDAADPDMLARALEGSAPAMRLSESDIEPLDDDGEHTMIGAMPVAPVEPAEQLADLVDRHLADAEAEAEADDFRELHAQQQAAYHISPYREARLDEQVPEPIGEEEEEISDLDVLAEADEADADLLAAHGEADALQRGRGRRAEVARLPTDDFASRLDLGDDTPAPQVIPQSLRYSPEAHSEDLDSALAALDGDFDEAAGAQRKRPLPGLPTQRPPTSENRVVKPQAKTQSAPNPRKSPTNPTTPPAAPVRTPPKRATTDDGILIDFDDDE